MSLKDASGVHKSSRRGGGVSPLSPLRPFNPSTLPPRVGGFKGGLPGEGGLPGGSPGEEGVSGRVVLPH